MNKDDLQNLIYLVVDGEATESERSVLFRHLSEDTELQDEFQDAIHFSKNIEMEKKAAALPIALTASLFDKAGIPADYLGLREAKPGNSTGGLINTSGNFLTGVLSNKIISGILFFALGVVSTVLFVEIGGNKKPIQGKKLSTIFDKKPVAGITQSYYPDSNKDKLNANNIEKSKVLTKTRIHENKIISHFEHFPYSDTERSIRITDITVPEKSGLSARNQISFITPKINMQPVKQLSPVLPEVTDETNSFLKGIYLEVNGIGGIAYLPGRNITSTPPGINNLAGKIGYYISDRSSVGLEGGIETYPVYVKDINNALIPTYSLFYLGAYYKIDIEEYYAFGKIVPNIELFTGGTKTGLMIRTSAGISYYPENILGLSFGITNTGVFSTYLTKMNYTNKIGFYYGINLKF